MDLGLGNGTNLLLFSIGPSLLFTATWGVACTVALRRWRLGTPGAAPLIAGTGLLAASQLFGTAWAWLFLFDDSGTMAIWEHPAMIALNLTAFAASFAAPPLILWGLILTWRGYDRAAAGGDREEP